MNDNRTKLVLGLDTAVHHVVTTRKSTRTTTTNSDDDVWYYSVREIVWRISKRKHDRSYLLRIDSGHNPPGLRWFRLFGPRPSPTWALPTPPPPSDQIALFLRVHDTDEVVRVIAHQIFPAHMCKEGEQTRDGNEARTEDGVLKSLSPTIMNLISEG